MQGLLNRSTSRLSDASLNKEDFTAATFIFYVQSMHTSCSTGVKGCLNQIQNSDIKPKIDESVQTSPLRLLHGTDDEVYLTRFQTRQSDSLLWAVPSDSGEEEVTFTSLRNVTKAWFSSGLMVDMQVAHRAVLEKQCGKVFDLILQHLEQGWGRGLGSCRS